MMDDLSSARLIRSLEIQMKATGHVNGHIDIRGVGTKVLRSGLVSRGDVFP